MKTDIHPAYFDTAVIRCSCGNVITTGSTKEMLKTELCSKCHPFYTGTQKLVDTAGRVDRFEAHRRAAELHKQAVVEHERLKKMKKLEPKVEKKKTKAVAEKIVKTVKTAKKTPVKKTTKAKK